MRSRPTAVLILVLLAAASVGAQTPTPAPPTLKDLAFLSGHWGDGAANRVSEEVWSPPSGDAMVGMRRLVSDGKLVSVEALSIREEAGGPVLRLRRFDADLVARDGDQSPVILPLVDRADRYARFAGRGTGSAGEVTVSYKLEGGTLRATVTREGKTEDHRYRPVRGDGTATSKRWGGRRQAP